MENFYLNTGTTVKVCYQQGYNQATAHYFAPGHTVFVISVPNWHIEEKNMFKRKIMMGCDISTGVRFALHRELKKMKPE